MPNPKNIFMKTLSITALSFLLSFSSFAQNKFKLGLMGNMAVNNFKSNTDNLKSDGSGLGFGFGLISDFYFSDNYAFGTGISIINQKFGVLYASKDTTELNQYALRNLEIPIGLKFQSNPINKIRLVGNFGGIFGTNIFAKKTQEFRTSSGSYFPNKEIDAGEDINLFNAQFVIGGGIFYPLNGDTGIEAILDYKNGLTDLLDGNLKSGLVNSIGVRIALIF